MLISKKEFDSESVYNKLFLKTKKNLMVMKLQIFTLKKIPKVDSNHTCLAVISLDSALKGDGNYYPQEFLKKCKYIEKKVIRQISDSLSDFYDEFDDSDEKCIKDTRLIS